MSLRTVIRNTQLSARWLLIHWIDEDALSIVCEDSVTSNKEKLVKGEMCKIKIKRKIYEGKIIEIGEKNELEKLEQNYLKCEGTDDGKKKNVKGKENKDGKKKCVVRKRLCSSENNQPRKKQKKQKKQVMGSIITVTDHDHGILDNIIEEGNTDELEKDIIIEGENTDELGKDNIIEGENTDKLEKDTCTSDKEQEFCSKVDETGISDDLNNATYISDSGKCINSV